MSGNSCCVPGCLNSYPNAPEETTWYPFPEDEDLAKEWIATIGKNLEITKNTLVCSNHFKLEDFVSPIQIVNRALLPKAVPSIFQSNTKRKINFEDASDSENGVNRKKQLVIMRNQVSQNRNISLSPEAVSSVLKWNSGQKVAENNLNILLEPEINFELVNKSENDDALKKEIDTLRNEISSVQNELETLKMAKTENQKLKEKTAKLMEPIISYAKLDLTTPDFISKIQKLLKIDVKPDKYLYHLSSDIWKNIFRYLSLDDIITLSAVCKDFQRIVQTIKQSFDFSHHYSLNIDYLLNYTLSSTCKSINLNHCYWLKPNEILDIISKTKPEHLHVIECKINEYCIDAISNLQLTSLSITYTEEWRFYFKECNLLHFMCIKSFQTLKSLTIFYKKTFLLTSKSIVNEIYFKVIHHCKQLEHLKIFDCNSRFYLSDHGTPSQIYSNETSPLPNLKSLIIKINNLNYEPDIAKFVAAILRDKVIPLEYVDFGYQTGYLFQKNILRGQAILWDKSPLLLSCLKTDFMYWLNFFQVKNLIHQPNQTKITTENIELNGFSEFVQGIVSNSGKTLKEIRINHSEMFKNFYHKYLDGLLHIALNCPQITVLDLSENDTGSHPYNNMEQFKKQEAIVDAIANLKNLKKLIISPQLLRCQMNEPVFNDNDDDDNDDDDDGNDNRLQAIPFWKVTKECKQLMEIRIENGNPKRDFHRDVHPDSLLAIAQCVRLRTLFLVNISILPYVRVDGKCKIFDLSQITVNCKQLNKICIHQMCPTFSSEWDLFAKNLKIISISKFKTFNVTKPFIDKLSLCENLEKIYLDSIEIKNKDCVRLAEAFLKLKNLQVVIIKSGLKRSANRKMDLILEKIAKERPAFYCSLSEYGTDLLKSIPLTHLDLIHSIKEYY